MDRNPAPGRFYAFNTTTSSNFPPPAHPASSQIPRQYSDEDSGSSDDGRALRGYQRLEQVQPPPDHRLPAFRAQNAPFDAGRRTQNANATLYVDDSPYIPPEASRPGRSAQFAHGATQAFPQTIIYDDRVPLAPPMTQAAPYSVRRSPCLSDWNPRI